ncbi:hypothetical protein IC582_006201 [Cucumis melo]
MSTDSASVRHFFRRPPRVAPIFTVFRRGSTKSASCHRGSLDLLQGSFGIS